MTARTAEVPIDMAAVGRVARRVSLQNLVLVGVAAERFPHRGAKGILDPEVHHDHRIVHQAPGVLEVMSKFDFVVHQEKTDVLKATFQYRLIYAVHGTDPVEEADARVFARANGAYHSWPFVREMLFGLTAKMGLPPFLLPVLSFQPPAPKSQLAAPPSAPARHPKKRTIRGRARAHE